LRDKKIGALPIEGSPTKDHSVDRISRVCSCPACGYRPRQNDPKVAELAGLSIYLNRSDILSAKLFVSQAAAQHLASNVRKWRILLQNSFCRTGHKFSEL
jgi:hypothetical protein